MNVPVAEAMLSSELWLSFLSLLRSYSAVASLNGGEAPRLDEFAGGTAFIAGSARLEFRYDAEASAGAWQLDSGNRSTTGGRFEMLAEGRISVDGKVLDLDHAAIDFAAFLMEAAGTSAREDS